MVPNSILKSKGKGKTFPERKSWIKMGTRNQEQQRGFISNSFSLLH